MDDNWLISELGKRFAAPVVAMDTAAGDSLQALNAGAADFVLIPLSGSDSDDRLFAADALERIKAASLGGRMIDASKRQFVKEAMRLLTIACSKGGFVPVACMLRNIPEEGPAVLIMQRNPEAFAVGYAEKLSGMCGRQIHVCQDGMELQEGCIYFVGSECRATIKVREGRILLQLGDISGGVDTLFKSMADSLGEEAACVLLSGGDGLGGLKRAAARGGLAIVYNKNSILREIGYKNRNGIVELPLEDITGAIVERAQ